MPPPFGPRTLTGIAVVLVAALAGWLLDRDVEVALIMLVGGIAAVLVTAGPGELPEPRLAAAPAEPEAREAPDVDAVIEGVSEPVLIVGAERVVHANSAARALLGRHIVGADVRLAIRHPAAAERLMSARPDGAPISLIGIGTLDQRWEMRVTPLGTRWRLVQLADQSQSYAAERMRVDFVANASHELRTPLASILGFVETLSDDKAGGDPEVRARFLKVLLVEARRMQRLVEDLISLSRIEAEKYRLPASPVDLAGLIEDVLGELADSPDQRGEDLIAEIDSGVPPVAGERAQLSQVLHNLIGNAMKYGRPGTPVVTRLWRDATGMVRVTVTDEGEGVPAEHLPRLTERFYRVDSGRSRALGGTGLGLSIVKHIVERHRGRLDIQSAVGVGTRVSVMFPAIGAQASTAKDSPSSKSNSNVTEARSSG